MGLRERQRVETQNLILEVASDLLSRKKFDTVTTQEIASEVGIAHGTLFRYVASKNELLLFVLNKKFAQHLDEIASPLQKHINGYEALQEIMHSLIDISLNNIENSLIYHGELLFGNGGEHRSEGLEILQSYEELICEIILRFSRRNDKHLTPDEALLASRSIIGAFQNCLVRIHRTRKQRECIADMDQQVEQIFIGVAHMNDLPLEE